MGCNCGGSKTANKEWVYTNNGETKVYTSELQAKAAQIRNGGGSITVRTRRV